MSRVPAGTFMHQPIPAPVEVDVIGGFAVALNRPNCGGCGRPLLQENAWMADGCPCNSAGWNNSMNETRWRLLMQLQQQQAHEIAELRRIISDQDYVLRFQDREQVTPNTVLLELPLDPERP